MPILISIRQLQSSGLTEPFPQSWSRMYGRHIATSFVMRNSVDDEDPWQHLSALILGMAVDANPSGQSRTPDEPTSSEPAVTASATLADAQGRSIGKTHLRQTPHGVLLKLDLENAAPGTAAAARRSPVCLTAVGTVALQAGPLCPGWRSGGSSRAPPVIASEVSAGR